jgi:N-acyl-D-aspartate/D-glutamate deacylase
MSENELLASVLSEIISLRDEVKKLAGTLNAMQISGCSKASDHMERQRDQEMRIRDLERWQNGQRGAMLAISSAISTAVTLAGIFISWLVSK